MVAADEDLLARIGEELASGVEAALPAWVEAEVRRIHDAWVGHTPDAVVDEARAAGIDAATEVGARLRTLLRHDIDDQGTNPMSIVRGAVRHPTGVLDRAGVPEVVRDEHAERLFPDDHYDLTPGSFGDLDPDLQALGLAWGAAKAKMHLARRR